MLVAELSDPLEVARFGKVESRICGDGFENDAGNLFSLFLKERLKGREVVEGEGGGERGEGRRDSGAVWLA